MEAQLRKPEMLITFTALLPGFTYSDMQAKRFWEALFRLKDEYGVKRLDGIIDR